MNTSQIWAAINEYAEACVGDTSSVTISVRRMDAVAAVERLLDAAQELLAASQELIEHVDTWDDVGLDEIAKLRAAVAKMTGGAT